jgi:hypothetical protein
MMSGIQARFRTGRHDSRQPGSTRLKTLEEDHPMSPLNPALFATLSAEFKSVRVSNPGARMVARYVQGPDGRPRKQVISPGEYYQINCIFCNDLRYRLWINHMWGVPDPRTGSRHRWAAKCFNEDCLADEDNRVELIRRASWYGRSAAAGRVEVLPGRVQADLGKPVPLPSDFVPLCDLEDDHPARQYVRGRGFDPDQLARDRRVGFSRMAFCLSSTGRLVIPVFVRKDEEFACWGWQARAIVEEQHGRYFTCAGLKRSCVLYGLELVQPGDGAVMICEGATDVWRAGNNAVALLGCHAAEEQVRLIRKHLRGRPLIVALDPDAREDAKRLVNSLRSARARSVLRKDATPVIDLQLPKGRDPADLPTKELWRRAQQALARSNSKL